ncbi:DUF1428 family protein [Paralimibaculum aggregatum]|uniref:DUF1428 family protein n=1 Tax=Paralimibaculum aggregatum TaxID=3036245 RepID=A0ABQ6LQV2_9RHOB|nr:DUF1428 family protein [Limibaculum sp. NKW23]GMG84073.1 DUF1428 family protein [Limibaculum sp. NKW23]
MAFVDVFVVAVKTARRADYAALCARVGALMRELGGEMEVCWGTEVPVGELTSFPRAVQCSEDETVVVGWTRWPDRAARDAALPKMMADPRMQDPVARECFEGRRLIFGGFETLA